MKCNECDSKPIVRGLRVIKCFYCGEEKMGGWDDTTCLRCSNKLKVCQTCNKSFVLKIGKEKDIEISKAVEILRSISQEGCRQGEKYGSLLTEGERKALYTIIKYIDKGEKV